MHPLSCFEKNTHKQTSSFICFDVEDLYPMFILISDDNLSIFIQARKTLLFEGTVDQKDLWCEF